MVAGLGEHDLLTYASAIAFRALTALIPLTLFGLALLAFLNLGETWTDHLAPDVRSHVSQPVFEVIDQAVRNTLSSRRGYWLTGGLLLALWEVSSAVRAMMGALSRIYGGPDRRSRSRRYLTSFALGVALIACTLLAVVAWQLAPPLVGDAGPWGTMLGVVAAGVLLSTAVWLLLRFAPAEPQSDGWVSFGSGLCVLTWILASVGFWLYAGDIANYSSIFGSLAAVFLLLAYLYVSACAFLIGAQVDALVREHKTGRPGG